VQQYIHLTMVLVETETCHVVAEGGHEVRTPELGTAQKTVYMYQVPRYI
jgi:hypothetical protein